MDSVSLSMTSAQGDMEFGSLERPLKISELTSRIKSDLESRYSTIAIIGEVSNFKPHSSGHFYFSLKDEGAAISAVMFRANNQLLRFNLSDGQQVIAIGKISVYAPRGNYQIVIQRLEPAGLGALQMAFEQLKKKLELEGLFDAARKRPIPAFPRCVGIVTSPTGAAIQDMLQILARRFSGLRLILAPVKVQGDGAAREVADAIDTLSRHFPEVEVLIVGRGGGSLEDLWAFNEEIVARAIATSKVPVISAVGHEVDFTIADFVADLRAPTPSAAAELVIQNRLETIRHVDHLVRRLSTIESKLEFIRLQLDDLKSRLLQSLPLRVRELRYHVESLLAQVRDHSPARRLLEIRHRFQMLVQQIVYFERDRLKALFFRVDGLGDKLELLDPRAIMNRGFSIVRNARTKKIIKKASDIQIGDELLIELSKGQIRARV